MDYVEFLAREARIGHAAFHEYALAISTLPRSAVFLFFEGDEDPSFYLPHFVARVGERSYRAHVCYGRSEVLKAHALVVNDGRAVGRACFFVDKDHTDIVPSGDAVGPEVFITTFYSIENYLACESVFRRYWVERLHLSQTDVRLPSYIVRLETAMASFYRRASMLMAAVLLGRGFGGTEPAKLNLNNVRLENVLHLDVQQGTWRYKPGAMKHFLASSNIGVDRISMMALRRVVRECLRAKPPKNYVRGKYELWAFWKLLSVFTKELSDKEAARQTGNKRATPSSNLSYDGCVESLSALLACPNDLSTYLVSYR